MYLYYNTQKLYKDTKRLEYIDIAKGIGIFLIVLGHMLKNGLLRQFIFSFHVPLFFFLSGITFNYKSNLKSFIVKKAKRILVPYVFFSIISIIIFTFAGKMAANSLNSTIINDSILMNLVGMIYANSRNNLMFWNQPLWFLPCLFVVYFFAGIIEIFLYSKNNIFLKRIFIITIFLCFFKLYEIIPNVIILPFSMEQAIIMIPYFELGLIFKEKCLYNKILNFLNNRNYLYIIFLIVCIFLCISLSYINGFSQVRTINFGYSCILFILCSLLGIIITLLISILLKNCLFFCIIGLNTMSILLLHKFFILFFQVLCPLTKTYYSNGNSLLSIIICIICSIVTIVCCYIVGDIIKVKLPIIMGE